MGCGIKFWGSGFRVQGSRVQGLRFRVWALGSRVAAAIDVVVDTATATVVVVAAAVAAVAVDVAVAAASQPPSQQPTHPAT